MKATNGSDSLGAFMSICTNSTDEERVSNTETSAMFGLEDECSVSEKKRRLSNEQVKALEKYFEVENKLEPERKVKLAQELGLQPRQVAVWFQNRRARWKTKNLERDYGVLQANYDALKQEFEALKRDNESLFKEIQELKSTLNEEDGKSESQVSVKEEPFVEEELNENSDNKGEGDTNNHDHVVVYDSKDGSCDSDSSAVMNDDRKLSKFVHGGSSMEMGFEEAAKRAAAAAYQPQFVKIEELNLFGEDDESCTTTFFSDEQAPTLNWYNPGEWN